MKLTELKKIIDEMIEENSFGNAEELQVVVITHEPSIGPRAATDVIGLSLGFDWEHGRAIIETDHRLIKESKKKV